MQKEVKMLEFLFGIYILKLHCTKLRIITITIWFLDDLQLVFSSATSDFVVYRPELNVLIDQQPLTIYREFGIDKKNPCYL